MASLREANVRVSGLIQYLGLTVGGVCLGWLLGGQVTEFLFSMFIQKAPYDWGFQIIESLSGSYDVTPSTIESAVEAIVLLGRFGIAIYVALVLIHGYRMYVEILTIKLTHRIVYFMLRGQIAEEFNIFADYLWAMTYSICHSLIPLVGFIVLFFVGLSVAPLTWDFMFALMPGGFAGALAALKLQEIVYELLFPHRLLREIQLAPNLNEMIGRVAEERRKKRERDR